MFEKTNIIQHDMMKSYTLRDLHSEELSEDKLRDNQNLLSIRFCHFLVKMELDENKEGLANSKMRTAFEWESNRNFDQSSQIVWPVLLEACSFVVQKKSKNYKKGNTFLFL